MTDEESLFAAIHESIALHAHDASWAARFVDERDRLTALFPGLFVDIQHIGSTAVCGLVAKPIIDLLAGVESMAVAASLSPALCNAGYTTSAGFNAALRRRQQITFTSLFRPDSIEGWMTTNPRSPKSMRHCAV